LTIVTVGRPAQWSPEKTTQKERLYKTEDIDSSTAVLGQTFSAIVERDILGESDNMIIPAGSHAVLVVREIARNETHDLRTATDELLSTLARSNPGLSRPSSYDRTLIGGRQGLHTAVSNGSNAAGLDSIAPLSLYMLAVQNSRPCV